MRTALVIAMIFGVSASAFASQPHHHARAWQTPPESFLGLQDAPRPAPFATSRGMCNGGACSLTGGPSGGPNQS